MRNFPLEYEKKKEVRFFPSVCEKVSGDFLEIGPGNGKFLIHLARTHPDRKIVALELDRKTYNKLCRRLERQKIKNVILIGGNARVIIPRYFSSVCFERVYVFFPDPWPKRRYSPNRLMIPEFMPILSSIISPEGLLYVATDVRAYADQIAKNILLEKSLNIIGNPFSPVEMIDDYKPTFFEGLATRSGVDINYLVVQKNRRPAKQ